MPKRPKSPRNLQAARTVAANALNNLNATYDAPSTALKGEFRDPAVGQVLDECRRNVLNFSAPYLAKGVTTNEIMAYRTECNNAFDQAKDVCTRALEQDKQAELATHPSDADKKKIEERFKKKQEAVDEYFKKAKKANDEACNTILYTLNSTGHISSPTDPERIRALNPGARDEEETEFLTMKRSGLRASNMGIFGWQIREKMRQQNPDSLFFFDNKERNFKLTVKFNPKDGSVTLDGKEFGQLGPEQRSDYYEWATNKLLGAGFRDIEIDDTGSIENQLEAAKYIMLHSKGAMPLESFFKRMDQGGLENRMTRKERKLFKEVQKLRKELVNSAEADRQRASQAYAELHENQYIEQATENAAFLGQSSDVDIQKAKVDSLVAEVDTLGGEMAKKYGSDPKYGELTGTVALNANDLDGKEDMIKDVLGNMRKGYEKIADVKAEVQTLVEKAQVLADTAAARPANDPLRADLCRQADALLAQARDKVVSVNTSEAELNTARDHIKDRLAEAGKDVEFADDVTALDNAAAATANAPGGAVAAIDALKTDLRRMAPPAPPAAPAAAGP